MKRYDLILGFLLVFAVGVAFGQEKSTMIGVKGGLIGSGTIYIEDFEVDSDLSYSLGGFLDYQLGPKFYGGLLLDLHNISAADESKLLFNFGVALKALIGGNNGGLRFRPGLQLGYGTVGKVAGTESSQYFTVGGFVEVLFPTSGNLTFLGELGIYAGPAGGNSDFDITFGPMLLARGGIIF